MTRQHLIAPLDPGLPAARPGGSLEVEKNSPRGHEAPGFWGLDMGEGGTAVRGTWRFRVGVTIFVVGFAAPLAIPLVISSDLPAAWKTAITGVLAVGVPEVMLVVAAAIMGSEGFAELKRRSTRFIARYGPPGRVSPTRYRMGLAMFTLPLLLAWLAPYLGRHLPGYGTRPVAWALTADVLFVTSFFVLGGDFWDKLRALFVHGAKAVFPSAATDTGGSHE